MHSDDNSAGGRVPLTGADGAAWAAEPEPRAARRDGIRRARRASNWTAAALIAGTGVAAIALADHALPVTAPASAATGAAGTAGVAGTAGTSGSSGPAVSHSVATTSGSGVTTTTTTRVVNGKTIITRTQHAPAYSDN
jgi:hypothetical protein